MGGGCPGCDLALLGKGKPPPAAMDAAQTCVVVGYWTVTARSGPVNLGAFSEMRASLLRRAGEL